MFTRARVLPYGRRSFGIPHLTFIPHVETTLSRPLYSPCIRPSTSKIQCSVRTRRDGCRRSFITDGLPTVLVPPVIFTGLLLTLWTYKSIMTVIFQDKIIYMPYMPPFARSEKMEDYTAICQPVQWEQQTIRSLDATKLSICIGRLDVRNEPKRLSGPRRKEVVICYFHGNGSAVPPRLPLLSGVLKAIGSQTAESTPATTYTLIALSYRGYWTSSGRASQTGIEQDAQALLQWISSQYSASDADVQLILWGQSIGAGVASTGAATWISDVKAEKKMPIIGMVLETPFTGIKGMLLALYPQKWLPYRYLSPFLWNHWDSELALQQIARSGHPPQILLMPATRDEVVPPEEADKLESIGKQLKLPMVRKDVIGALHTTATIRRDGQDYVAKFVIDTVKGSSRE